MAEAAVERETLPYKGKVKQGINFELWCMWIEVNSSNYQVIFERCSFVLQMLLLLTQSQSVHPLQSYPRTVNINSLIGWYNTTKGNWDSHANF